MGGFIQEEVALDKYIIEMIDVAKQRRGRGTINQAVEALEAARSYLNKKSAVDGNMYTNMMSGRVKV